MRRIVGMVLVVLCSVILVNAQSQSDAKAMSGTICPSACVTQGNNGATCSKSCTDTSSPAVFISDEGKVMRIAEENQNMCQSHMGKHVKMMAAPTKGTDQQEELRIFRMQESGTLGG
jgi:hypothetical protein